jgi:hypothetical protein
MNFIKKLPVFLALAFLGIPTFSFAQYHYDCDPFFSYFKDPKRWDLSMGIVAPFGQFGGSVGQYASNNYFRGDTTIKRNMMAQLGVSGAIGVFAPFKGTGHISYWGMDVQIMVSEYIWQNLNQTIGTDGTYTNNPKPVSALTLQMATPIGVSYKVGCDAILSKRLPLCAAFGAGIIPQLNYTNLESINQFNAGYGWSVLPYAKMDLGFFAGICWKLRFMYSYGKVNLFDANAQVPGLTQGPFSIASTSNLMVSLVIMPFSFQWPETGWWNTYDTYNKHDRFN